jgi:amino acid transporter
VTYLFSAIAVVLLPFIKKDLWRASPASKVKLFGVPIVPVSGVITILLLGFCLIAWLVNDNYFVNNPSSLIFMGAMYVLAIVLYVVARVVRGGRASTWASSTRRSRSSSLKQHSDGTGPAASSPAAGPVSGRGTQTIGGIQQHE